MCSHLGFLILLEEELERWCFDRRRDWVEEAKRVKRYGLTTRDVIVAGWQGNRPIVRAIYFCRRGAGRPLTGKNEALIGLDQAVRVVSAVVVVKGADVGSSWNRAGRNWVEVSRHKEITAPAATRKCREESSAWRNVGYVSDLISNINLRDP